MSKPFKSIDNQIALIKSRGMVIENENYACSFLLKHNYYNVMNCYGKFLKLKGINKADEFIPGSNFSEVEAILNFDRKLKSVIFRYVLIIEDYFRSILAYTICEMTNDSQSYLKGEWYINSKGYLSLLKDLTKIIDENLKTKNNAIYHYKNQHNEIPLWVLIDFMTFGQSIRLFNYFDISIQREVSRRMNDIINEKTEFNDVKLYYQQLYVILDNLKNLRNLVAHNNKIFNYKSRYEYPLIEELYCKDESDYKNRRSVFDSIVILRVFLTECDSELMFKDIRNLIIELEDNLKTIKSSDVLNNLGFSIKLLNKLCTSKL